MLVTLARKSNPKELVLVEEPAFQIAAGSGFFVVSLCSGGMVIVGLQDIGHLAIRSLAFSKKLEELRQDEAPTT